MKRQLTFKTLEEAFAALPEEIREHSYRVEKYADMIFMEVCASDEYIMNMNSRIRLRYENRPMIGLAARYHDIGKVLVPDVYQTEDDDFSPEERALYLRHTQGGEKLARDIMREEMGTSPMLIDTICEGIYSHHEWWDGTGTPTKAVFEDIPIVGRIVAVADALDHLLMETRTETPIATALDTMMMQSSLRFDPVIMGLIYEQKYKIEKIFALYSSGSRAVPQSPRIIRRKSGRPMWLKYRPILRMEDKKMVAVRADMVFRRGKEEISYKEVEPYLKAAKKTWEVQLCFITEAWDMITRMTTCEIPMTSVSLNCIGGFWKKRGAATKVAAFIADIDADPKLLAFILDRDNALNPSANVIENCHKLAEAGCGVIYSGVSLDELDPDKVIELEANYVCLETDGSVASEKNAKKLKKLESAGIGIVGAKIDKHRQFGVLSSLGIDYAFGDLIGEYETETDFIAGELAASQK